MKYYEDFGFGYISPNHSQQNMATKFQLASQEALATMQAMGQEQTLIKNAGIDCNDGVNTIAKRFVMGQNVVGFMAAAHQTTHLAFADVGLFRDPDQYKNTRYPRISTLCTQITELGDTSLKLLGLTRPLPLEKAQELYPEGSALPTATVGLIRYVGHSIRRRETSTVPRAFINVSDQPQTWHIGFNDMRRRQTLVQERGGIVIYETRPDKTQNPNPYYVLEAHQEGVGAQLMVSTTHENEFDKKFGLA
jgi:hypothetical protein